jgi:hypothetical protein
MYLSGPLLSPLPTAKSRGIWCGVRHSALPFDIDRRVGSGTLDAASPMLCC